MSGASSGTGTTGANGVRPPRPSAGSTRGEPAGPTVSAASSQAGDWLVHLRHGERWLAPAFGPAQAAVEEPRADGRPAVELGGPWVPVLTAQFAGFGHPLEITTPEARARLLAPAAELRDPYAIR